MDNYVPAEQALLAIAAFVRKVNAAAYLRRLRVIERARWLQLLRDLKSNENTL